MKQKISFTKKCLFFAFVWILCLLISGVALPAEKFPEKTIKIIVPWGAGGTIDLMARMQASLLTESFGQPVVVINRPGAAGTVGTAAVADSKPDGYTVGAISMMDLSLCPFFMTVKYNPLTDFEMLGTYAELNYGVCVRPDAPWRSLRELIGYARQNPNTVTYSSVGGGMGPIEIAFQYIEKVEKMKLWKGVPYSSGVESVVALMGGHVQVNCGSGSHLPYLKSGKIRLLAAFGDQRMPDYPDVPTVNEEIGFDFPGCTAQMIAVPKGVPEPIRKTLEDAFKKSATSPPFVAYVKTLMQEPRFKDSATTKKSIETEYKTYKKIIDELGLKPAQ